MDIRLLSTEHSTVEQQRWGRDVIDRQAHRMALLLDDLLEAAPSLSRSPWKRKP